MGASTSRLPVGAFEYRTEGATTNDNLTIIGYVDIGNTSEAGQFILGQPTNHANAGPDRLPTVAERYPEILNSRQDKDDGPSCSAVEALERQSPFVNQVLASNALALLARLFRYGSIDHVGAFINLATGQMVPVPCSN